MERLEVLKLYVYRADGSLDKEKTIQKFADYSLGIIQAMEVNVTSDLALMEVERQKLPETVSGVFYRYHSGGCVAMPLSSLVHFTFCALYGIEFDRVMHNHQTLKRIESFIRGWDGVIRDPSTDEEVYLLRK